MSDGSGKYDVIYADPPWHFGTSLPSCTTASDGTQVFKDRALEEFQYPTMRPGELRELFQTDVHDIAADDAVLIMWTTDAHLPLAVELGKLAGFEYKTVAFVWNKKTPKGNQVCYMGRWTCKGSEIALLFSKGRAHSRLLKARNVRQLVEAERREHSRKPDEVRHRIETMFPGACKIELFARETVPGWDSWGNETDKFNRKGN